MYYCHHCHLITQDHLCPDCGNTHLREVEAGDFCLIGEKEEMWAKLFLEILDSNHIPYTFLPVLGAGVVIKAGKTERYRIYVPYEKLSEAQELWKETFETPDFESI